MVRPSCRLLLLTALLACLMAPQAPAAASPQPAPPGSDTGVSGRSGQSVVPLNGPWKFHTGDDPQWAAVSFDDSGWQDYTIDPEHPDPTAAQTIESHELPGWQRHGHPGYTGYAWYRIRIRVPSGVRAVALMMPQNVDDAYEVYIDGEKVGGFGKLSGWRTVYPKQTRIFPIPAGAQNNAGAATLAIRMWSQRDEALPSEHNLDGNNILDAHRVAEYFAAMPMWTAFWHLFRRALVYFPSELSANWLSVLLPVGLYFLREALRFRSEGRRAMKWSVLERDTKLMVGAYIVLFLWAMVHTIYEDHITLQNQNVAIRRQIAFRNTHGVSLAIESVVGHWVKFGLQLQVNLLASNDGHAAAALEDWSAKLDSRKGTMVGEDDYGIPPFQGSPPLPPLDVELAKPTDFAQLPGLVTFIFPPSSKTFPMSLMCDPGTTLTVSALDLEGRKISTTKRLKELCDLNHEEHVATKRKASANSF